LRVPAAYVGHWAEGLYAAVESVPNHQRNIRPWLDDPHRISNFDDLFAAIAVDIWLANTDRNMGNLVGSTLGDGRIDVFMIDFEKSRSLLRDPFIGCGSIDPGDLWPTDELGAYLRKIRRARCPQAILDRIERISEQQIVSIVSPVAAELHFVDWHDSSIEVLFRRAQKIVTLVEEVWRVN
jgi:hypothetical protein